MTEGRHDAVLARLRAISVLLALGLAVVGCGGGDPVAQPTTTLTQEARDEAELTQLAADWSVTLFAVFTNEADVSAAADYLANPYLQQFEQQVVDFRESGNSTERSPESGSTVTAVNVSGDDAVIEECSVNADLLIGPDGDVINDDVTARMLETEARRTADGWRFVGRTTTSENTGSHGVRRLIERLLLGVAAIDGLAPLTPTTTSGPLR